MAILSDQIRQQLQQRFAERLDGGVRLRLLTRPGSGRLILPGAAGCPTCGEAQELAREIVDSAPDKLSLEVVDLGTPGPLAEEEQGVPRLEISKPDEEPRIAFQGLPGGYEFATVVDAVERVSRGDVGLSEESISQLGRLGELAEPVEIMVFATPT